jgi:hypothetical protein
MRRAPSSSSIQVWVSWKSHRQHVPTLASNGSQLFGFGSCIDSADRWYYTSAFGEETRYNSRVQIDWI